MSEGFCARSCVVILNISLLSKLIFADAISARDGYRNEIMISLQFDLIAIYSKNYITYNRIHVMTDNCGSYIIVTQLLEYTIIDATLFLTSLIKLSDNND